MQTKFDPKVLQLGYVALGTPDIEPTKHHYLQIMGMTEVERGADGSVYLSIGYNHHDLVLRPTDQKALLHVGFHLKPHVLVSDLARDRANSASPRPSRPTASPALPSWSKSRPQAASLSSSTRDCSPGSRLQAHRASPLRLGHVVIISPDGDKLIAFFKDFLGFVLTDDIAGIANFLTCNRDHHVVNIVKAPELRGRSHRLRAPGELQHGSAADALRAAGVSLLWGPSRNRGPQRGGLPLRTQQSDDRALYRDGSIHPGTRYV